MCIYSKIIKVHAFTVTPGTESPLHLHLVVIYPFFPFSLTALYFCNQPTSFCDLFGKVIQAQHIPLNAFLICDIKDSQELHKHWQRK